MAALQILVFLAAIAVGIVSFGFGMTTMPFLLIWLEPVLAVEINLILTSVLFIVVSSQTWRFIDRSTFFALLLGSLVGVPLGTYVAASAPDSSLRLALTSVIIATAMLGMVGRLRYLHRERLAAVPIGASYGFLNAGLALGGPIVALFALNQRWGRDRTRAMLSSFFLVTSVIGLASHAISGLMGAQELRSGAIFIPVLLAGAFIATRLVGRVDEALFRRLVLTVLLAASFGVLVREIVRLL